MTKYQVLYFAYSNKNSVKEFIDSLERKQKNKIFRLFQLIEEYGISTIPQHTKKLHKTPFREIRILGKDNIRLLFIIEKSSAIIFYGFFKKTQKTPVTELTIADRSYKQWKISLNK